MWSMWDAGIPTRGDSVLADDGVSARWFRPALVGLVVAVACDFLDEIDDAPPKLGFLDSHEGLGQREPFGGGEKIRHIGRRGRLLRSVARSMQVGRALEEERYRDLQDVRNLLQPARADAVGAL